LAGHKTNPYEPPKDVRDPHLDRQGGVKWLARGFATVLWASTAFLTIGLGSALVLPEVEEVRSSYAETLIAIYSVSAFGSVAWAGAGYLFWTGKGPKLRWFLFVAPAVVLVGAAMSMTLLGVSTAPQGHGRTW
jgi:hypothetical protein